jgi:ABC-type polysaccharide/polyol phosphate transport system ATPase subunit
MYAVEFKNICKKYNIYERPADRLKEIIWRNTRSYHREFWALKDINLNIEAGTTTAILGPNGSGKSTLLQLMAKVLQPTSGTMTVNGRVTAILELGAGFQPEYSGRENVLLNGMILGIPEAEMIERLDQIAEFAEVGDFFDQPTKTYSSGMVVRLAFASAISVDPEILLVDEALAVGDARFQAKCIAHLEKMRAQGKTIIFVSHDTAVVRAFCHKAVLLNGGQVTEQGSVLDVVPKYEELMSEEGLVAQKVFVAPVS